MPNESRLSCGRRTRGRPMRPLLLPYSAGAQTQQFPTRPRPTAAGAQLGGGWALVSGRAAPTWNASPWIDDRASPRRRCHRNTVRGAAHQGSKGVAGRAHRQLAPGVIRVTALAFDGNNNVVVLGGNRRVDHPPPNESRLSCGRRTGGRSVRPLLLRYLPGAQTQQLATWPRPSAAGAG